MIHIDDNGGVRTLRLDRPERLNAFDDVQFGRLADELAVCDAEPSVRVALITGTGRAFSAGADLKAITEPGAGKRFGQAFDRMLDTVAALATPVVAAVNGLAVGVGTTLLLHCDLVLAAESARFRTPFPQLGTAPEAASSLLLPMSVGPQWASWMLMTGEWVDAETAARIGLVLQVCPDDELMARSRAVATQLAALPPDAVAAAKRLQRHGLADLARAARARESAAAGALGGVDPLADGRGLSPSSPGS